MRKRYTSIVFSNKLYKYSDISKKFVKINLINLIKYVKNIVLIKNTFNMKYFLL